MIRPARYDKVVASRGARSRVLRIEGQRAKTVKDTTDLIAKALKDGTSLLIDVDMERNYKPM